MCRPGPHSHHRVEHRPVIVKQHIHLSLVLYLRRFHRFRCGDAISELFPTCLRVLFVVFDRHIPRTNRLGAAAAPKPYTKNCTGSAATTLTQSSHDFISICTTTCSSSLPCSHNCLGYYLLLRLTVISMAWATANRVCTQALYKESHRLGCDFPDPNSAQHQFHLH